MSSPPHTVHDWVSFRDDDGTEWMFDATFLCSDWTCIFGRGCKGVHEVDTTDLGHGCCSHGAHFADDGSDRSRVAAAIDRLRPDEWELADEARRLGGAIADEVDDSGNAVVRTRVVDDACILLNRAGFAGGEGCALHVAAVSRGERFIDWKPDVCWQLPLRLAYRRDENGNDTYLLHEWRREDWGEGGADFAWWCTDSPDAFIGSQPVYEELRDEIVELVGEERYRWFVDHIESRPSGQVLPHPTRRRPAAR